MSKRKLSLPPDEPSARCKADEKENAVVDESLSNEEISDNDSLASSDTSEEDNVYETVSFSSSEREIVFSSDDEDVQMEDWDDYALMEQSNNRLTFKSYKSIVRISKDFLSESRTCSYKRILWNPIWNVLKSQGESTTMRWKYGKNPSNLDLGPNWIFVPPKSGRKKVKGVDYFEKEDDVLREIFYCIRLINVRSISDGELSELGNLCKLDFHSSRKTRKVDSAEVSPMRSSTSRKDDSKTKIKTHDRERKSKSSSDLEKPKRNQKLDNTSSVKRKRLSSTSSTSKEKSSAHKKPKIRQREQRARKSKPFKKDIELSKSQCNDEDVKNTNEHSESTLAGADVLLALTHADANNHKCVADEQNHIQPYDNKEVEFVIEKQLRKRAKLHAKSRECTWNIRLNELREFRKKHGHCLVPQRTCIHFPRLGKWVINVRHRKNNQEKETPLLRCAFLTTKQIADLDNLNFEWDAIEAMWLEKFNELKEFHRVNGHSQVTETNCANRSLVSWSHNQRHRCNIEKRRKSLDSIKFSW